MAAAKPPANVPILDYDGRTMPVVWVAFFDRVWTQLKEQDAEIAALKARLTSAGIP